MASERLLKKYLRQPALNAAFYALVAPLVLLILSACMDASTLGGDAPDHVVISGTPTWSNGIGQLMLTKCAVCHQVPRLPTSPQKVPADLDLRYETTSGDIRAGEDIAAQIKLGVLRHTLDYRPGVIIISAMPPPFGTPLYADERAALETWADNVLSGNTVNDGALLYKRHCQSCHGMYGAGGLVQRPIQKVSGVYIANTILTPSYRMNSWPVLAQFANQCTPTGALTTCNGTRLDKISAYLAQF